MLRMNSVTMPSRMRLAMNFAMAVRLLPLPFCLLPQAPVWPAPVSWTWPIAVVSIPPKPFLIPVRKS
jgi:hypothetical protein